MTPIQSENESLFDVHVLSLHLNSAIILLLEIKERIMPAYLVKCTVTKTVDKTSALLLGLEETTSEHKLEFVVNHSDDDYEKELIEVQELIIAEYFSEWKLKYNAQTKVYVSMDAQKEVFFNSITKLPTVSVIYSI